MCPFLEAPDGLSPETLNLLDRAFSAAWDDLQMRKSSSTALANQPATQTAIAKALVDLAATGVREPERLKRHALHAAEQTRLSMRTTTRLPD